MKNRTMWNVVVMLIIALVSLGASGDGCEGETQTAVKDQEANEQSQKTLVEAAPAIQLKRSLSREALNRFLAEIHNNPDKVRYIYHMSDDGKVEFTDTIKGPLMSVNCYLTVMEQVVSVPMRDHNGKKLDSGNRENMMLEAPDQDGTFGQNAEWGIFYYNDKGKLHQARGKYHIFDEEMEFSGKPIFTPKPVSVEK